MTMHLSISCGEDLWKNQSSLALPVTNEEEGEDNGKNRKSNTATFCSCGETEV